MHTQDGNNVRRGVRHLVKGRNLMLAPTKACEKAPNPPASHIPTSDESDMRKTDADEG